MSSAWERVLGRDDVNMIRNTACVNEVSAEIAANCRQVGPKLYRAFSAGAFGGSTHPGGRPRLLGELCAVGVTQVWGIAPGVG